LRGPEVEIEHEEGETAYSQEEQKPGEELPGEDDLVADLLEPPPIGEQGYDGGKKEKRRETGEEEDEDQAASQHGMRSG
jgi:hypothetical protein